MRHQRMMFSQEFLDFHQNIVSRNLQLITDEFNRSGQRKTVSDETREVINELVSLSASFLFNIGCRLNHQYRKILLVVQDAHEMPWYNLMSELLRINDASRDLLIEYFDTDTLRQFL